MWIIISLPYRLRYLKVLELFVIVLLNLLNFLLYLLTDGIGRLRINDRRDLILLTEVLLAVHWRCVVTCVVRLLRIGRLIRTWVWCLICIWWNVAVSLIVLTLWKGLSLIRKRMVTQKTLSFQHILYILRLNFPKQYSMFRIIVYHIYILLGTFGMIQGYKVFLKPINSQVIVFKDQRVTILISTQSFGIYLFGVD